MVDSLVGGRGTMTTIILTYGVMVTQQTLVLLFEVRILVGQQSTDALLCSNFLYRFIPLSVFPRGYQVGVMGRIGCYVVRHRGFFK